jgi:hypothetical protein
MESSTFRARSRLARFQLDDPPTSTAGKLGTSDFAVFSVIGIASCQRRFARRVAAAAYERPLFSPSG